MAVKEIRNTLFEVTDSNGYIFCEKYDMPEELLPIILSYLEPKDLVFGCRRVCKTWCNIIDSQVWKLKIQGFDKLPKLPWFAYYWISKKVLNRNLIKNGCGQEGFKFWDVIQGRHMWKIEKPPLGCQNLPENADKEVLINNSCFVTCHLPPACFLTSDCVKVQIVDLAQEGATPKFMDVIKPKITVSEWIANRHDCGCMYRLSVTLLDEKKCPFQGYPSDDMKTRFDFLRTFDAGKISSWEKISHVFDDYGPGVRYIKFQHFGMDTQSWKGNYGTKMTGSSVILSFASD